jgi:MarR family transcriptional regulator, organic hydroperoxide resistance regulator
MSTRTKTKSDLAAELGAALGRIAKHTKRSVRHDLELVGLTVPQAMALHTLAAAGGRLSGRDLGRECDMLASTATGVVDRLEQHGYVRRVRDEEDRRVVWVQMTEAGSQLQERLPAFTTYWGRTFTVLPTRELEQLVQLVQRVEDAIETEGSR